MVSVQIMLHRMLGWNLRRRQECSISWAFLSTLAVRLKYSLLSSFFLEHSSLITSLWLATSLARNLLSPSVIILILIWLIIGGVANNYAGSGLKLYVRSHSLFNALRNFLAALSPSSWLVCIFFQILLYKLL